MALKLYLVIILAILGIFNTAYLIRSDITQSPINCLFFPEDSCAKVEKSEYSKILGIPNSYLGFIFYSLVLILAILVWGKIIPRRPLQILIIIGLLFSLYFIFLQALVIRAWCVWCWFSALDVLLLFGLMVV